MRGSVFSWQTGRDIPQTGILSTVGDCWLGRHERAELNAWARLRQYQYGRFVKDFAIFHAVFAIFHVVFGKTVMKVGKSF